jgi:ferric-chelate reductase
LSLRNEKLVSKFASKLNLHRYTLENHSSVCVAKVGDWTGALHTELSKPSSRPGYIYGPFPSPFSKAVGYDNLIAVASGIGITPTLGAVTQLRQSRKVSVMWMCREAPLVEYFVRNCTFDDDAWSLIFYTGKRRLLLDETQFRDNPRLLIIQGRPDVEKDILSIMQAIEGDTLLDDKILRRARDTHEKIFNRSPAESFQALLERALATYTMSELFLLGVIFTENATSAKNEGMQMHVKAKEDETVTLDGFRDLVYMLGGAVQKSLIADDLV